MDLICIFREKKQSISQISCEKNPNKPLISIKLHLDFQLSLKCRIFVHLKKFLFSVKVAILDVGQRCQILDLQGQCKYKQTNKF